MRKSLITPGASCKRNSCSVGRAAEFQGCSLCRNISHLNRNWPSNLADRGSNVWLFVFNTLLYKPQRCLYLSTHSPFLVTDAVLIDVKRGSPKNLLYIHRTVCLAEADQIRENRIVWPNLHPNLQKPQGDNWVKILIRTYKSGKRYRLFGAERQPFTGGLQVHCGRFYIDCFCLQPSWQVLKCREFITP